MEYDDERLFNFVSGFIFGVAVGAGAALILAPESGKKTRRKIQRAAGDLRETATDRWDEASEEIRDRLDEVLEGARTRLS